MKARMKGLTNLQIIRIQIHHPSFNALVPSCAVIPSNLFHPFYLRPPANRPLKPYLSHFGESRLYHVLPHRVDHPQRLTELPARLQRYWSPLLERRAGDTAVLALRHGVDLHLFVPAAWFQRFEHFGIEGWVGGDAAEDLARVDEVEA